MSCPRVNICAFVFEAGEVFCCVRDCRVLRFFFFVISSVLGWVLIIFDWRFGVLLSVLGWLICCWMIELGGGGLSGEVFVGFGVF